MQLTKYSLGMGDRFAHQGKPQLTAIMMAKERGVHITPVWNKSFREHQIIGSRPVDARKEADNAVKSCGWKDAYFVDADHINLKNVDFFILSSDFFTIDVADYIGKTTDPDKVRQFVADQKDLHGDLSIPGIEKKFAISQPEIESIARKYLYAIEEAGRIYRYIASKKEKDSFVVEVSMDETDQPQSPLELLFILSGLAQEGIPVATIAPKFSGRFNKGVDYVGDLDQFNREFEQDVAVTQFAVRQFSLPVALKLSVHSGSDKFSLYGPIRKTLNKFDAGIHLKTAGTTWLEELIGLAESGGEGLELAKAIYRNAHSRFDELCAPYATVIDIDPGELPLPDHVDAWDGKSFASALRHDRTDPRYNRHLRQLLHVGYKIAAEMGEHYLSALLQYEDKIAENVTENMYHRHIEPLFGLNG